MAKTEKDMREFLMQELNNVEKLNINEKQVLCEDLIKTIPAPDQLKNLSNKDKKEKLLHLTQLMFEFNTKIGDLTDKEKEQFAQVKNAYDNMINNLPDNND